MYQSPRTRRLHNDLAALDRLRAESSVFRFSATGDPPHQYLISFLGRGLWRDRGKVKLSETHRVEIKLGASYPRTMPEIRWITPIYHPNISEIGMVCLGGYGTHWVPSIQLDELCVMLWDMVRYHNYDIRSPYNRDSALWVANQTTYLFPTDPRPLRDVRASEGRLAKTSEEAPGGCAADPPEKRNGAGRARGNRASLSAATPVARVTRLLERYRQAVAGARVSSRHGDPALIPLNGERHSSASSEVEPSAVAPPPLVPDDEVIILEAVNQGEPLPADGQTHGDEIVFIE
jgi:ubiquitin-protein ligase